VYAARDRLKLTPEQQRLLWLDYTTFVRAGAKLDAAAKGRLAELNQRLAGLYTKFSQNVLAEEDSQMVLLEKEADLAGLPATVRDGAGAAAAAAGSRVSGRSSTRAPASTRSSPIPPAAICARRSGACSSCAATTATRTTTTRPSPRS